jgi:serine/threonine protein phosphatase PrpC
MRFGGRTNPGRRGGQNEDSIGWSEPERLWFVADGMGGHASGDVASRIVKETLLGSALTLPLNAAVMQAHAAVAATAESNPAYNNMGSTVVVARIADRQAHITWVGDSRAYLWREQTLRQLTRDHSFLEVLREQEHLSDSQLRGHPHKNLVTQTLGIGTPQPASISEPLRRRDWLLLCSDGLNDELEDGEIAAVLRAQTTPEDAATALVDAALTRGGRDNVSAIVVEYDGPDDASFGGALAAFLANKALVLGSIAIVATIIILFLVYKFVV